MQPLSPAAVRYIKLGTGGAFARACLEQGEIHLDYRAVPHDLCVAGDWNAVIDQFVNAGRTRAKARDAKRELEDFYTLGTDCLWITFVDGHIWWAFAEPEVHWRGGEDANQGARWRRVVGAWRNTTLAGEVLRSQDLSSKLTRVANYRQTLCKVEHADYLVRRINGTAEPIVADAEAARSAMLDVAQRMMTGLHWADFEIMVDLILARGGWQRVSVLGKTLADVDLVIEQPMLGERAVVQVKSSADQAALNDFIGHVRASGADRGFFVCHSPMAALTTADEPGLHLWTGASLAALAVNSGLYDWLVERSG